MDKEDIIERLNEIEDLVNYMLSKDENTKLSDIEYYIDTVSYEIEKLRLELKWKCLEYILRIMF